MNRCTLLLPLVALCGAMCASAVPAHAADDDKVPYWASIDADKAYMRVGPGETYKIQWVYQRKRLPVKVIRREGPWRLLQDPAGDQGWMRDLLLSRKRSALVTGKGLVEMHAEGRDSSPMLWRLEPGVVGALGDCKDDWCALDVDGHKGFVPEAALWGAGEP